jgi:hypothetical protein
LELSSPEVRLEGVAQFNGQRIRIDTLTLQFAAQPIRSAERARQPGDGVCCELPQDRLRCLVTQVE